MDYGYEPVIEFLINEGYVDYLTKDELSAVVNNLNSEIAQALLKKKLNL
ncbi:MAG: hypothetical protein ACFFAH_02080 [Promethearchaeota archaeon]